MGELLALSTALLWAIGVIFFRRSVGVVSPLALNLFKNCVAFALLSITAIGLGQTFTVSIPSRDLGIMLLSGAIGIGISDTLFLITLRRMGASRTALIDCLYSPFVIVFSFVALGETLSALTACGGLMILGSVILSSRRSFGGSITQRQFLLGCLSGGSAMATVALAIVLVKPILNSYPLMLLSSIRMAGGITVLLPIILVSGEHKSALSAFRPQSTWKWMFCGTFFGSYLSLVCWLGGFKYSHADTAALLNQMSTVFIVILASLLLKEPLTRMKLAAVGMALLGAIIVIY